MKNIFKILKSPYPLAESLWRQVWRALMFGGFVFLFLAVFQPFGLSRAPSGIWAISLHFGFITTFSMFVLNVIIPAAFKDFFVEQHWTVGKEIIWTMLNVLIIAFANWYYSGFMGFINFNFAGFLMFSFYTIAIGIFPIAGLTIWKAYRLQKRYYTSSLTISEGIKKNATPKEIYTTSTTETEILAKNESLLSYETISQVLTQQLPLITLHGEGETEVFQIESEKLLYLKSSGNYVEIYFENGMQGRRVMRATLKNMSKELEAFPQFFRCHKQYIVNMSKVQHVSGNAQGLTLHLYDNESGIPVSRSLTSTIREKFAAG